MMSPEPAPPLKLHGLLAEDRILARMRAGDRDAVLEEMVAAAVGCVPSLTAAGLLEKLRERERLGSTAIGGGWAIPHGKVDGLGAPVVVLGVSSRGVDYAAPDGKPCRGFVLAVSASETPGQNLRILAAAAQLLRRSKDLLARIAAADTPREILAVIREEEERFP
jgi:PTS system nitrogen regulatory IIA component